ncbi:MAG: adenosylcobinamide-GDP ribazoletransferase [Candidatus Acididesulfobacter guangdongensis]|uniref:Adenosylcobinamide-GDP ribazoletransferase n=1 Tax=Acididesulfobacter guangdongensis TaxID=2597225 RepID=A0A519BGX9_ACIG2|nr:MAG: adenosylcobinamide-GDP ribazoletransferase [Candidatus Acididesulfobacter guangdongensis]
MKKILTAISFLTIFNFDSIFKNGADKTLKSNRNTVYTVSEDNKNKTGAAYISDADVHTNGALDSKNNNMYGTAQRTDTGVYSGLHLVKSIKFFPLAGLFIGLNIAILYIVFNKITFSPGIASIISIAGLFIITGGLHFDGLSDTSDGLMAFLKTGDKNKFYNAMKDVNTGLAGTISVIFYIVLLYKIILDFNSFQTYNRLYGIYALICFPVVGRYTIVLMSYFTVTPENFRGIGSIFTEGTDILTFISASAITLIIVVLFFGYSGLFALLATSLIMLIVCYFFIKKFGGVNGDMLGFGVKISEIIFLISLLDFIKTGF